MSYVPVYTGRTVEQCQLLIGLEIHIVLKKLMAGRAHTWPGIRGCAALVFRSQKLDKFSAFAEAVTFQDGGHSSLLLPQLRQHWHIVGAL